MSQDSNRPPILLIASAPGMGKTQLVRALADDLIGRRKLSGFFKEEIKVGSLRRGYKLVEFTGEEMILAHINIESKIKSGKYGVDLKAFNEFLVTVEEKLSKGNFDLVFIDEVGKFEIYSDPFIAFLDRLVDFNGLVLITVARKSLGSLGKIRTSPRTQTLELTKSNRSTMKDKVMKIIEPES